jgi:hypothetical protein
MLTLFRIIAYIVGIGWIGGIALLGCSRLLQIMLQSINVDISFTPCLPISTAIIVFLIYAVDDEDVYEK